MPQEYEINDLAKEESWRMFRVIGELVEGFDKLSGIEPAVSIYGSARLKAEDELYLQIEEIANRLGQMGFSIPMTFSSTSSFVSKAIKGPPLYG